MPELPEVETIKNALSTVLLRNRVTDVKYFRDDLRDPIPKRAIARILKAGPITKVSRRSKYILVETSGGTVVFHLGMTGIFHCHPSAKIVTKHTHVIIEITGRDAKKSYLHFIDPRRFGRLGALGLGAEDWLASLGPEPFEAHEYIVNHLFTQSRRKKQPIKIFLMDPRRIVGVGNIYAAEALFRSGIHPHRPAGDLEKKEFSQLLKNIVKVLNASIEMGGTSFRDFETINGEKGYFSIHLDVYGRSGDPCRRCNQLIQKTVLAGRSTFFCEKCQKLSGAISGGGG